MQPYFESELAKIIVPRQGWLWTPKYGPETHELLHSVRAIMNDPIGQARVLEEACDILARCPPPVGSLPRSETGLAIGYVQSGKTMSFTTVAALARDNGYRIVIVVTGVSKPLTGQSRTRLVEDLRLATRPDRPWLHLLEEKPGSWAHRTSQIRGTLDAWHDPDGFPQDRRTVLITVMKHHGHLAAVTQMLRDVGRDILDESPTLIIDDEADQAGLNTLVQENDESTTYSRLLSLKQTLPIHSYLQYTATPQAPLLINIIDLLSPRFAALLTPGPAYVGGQSFFKAQNLPNLCRNIPANEIPQKKQTLPGAPESLLDALRVFFLGVAAGDILDGRAGNRSMLVHPTHLRNGHTLYAGWIREVVRQWTTLLGLPAGDPDLNELYEDFHGSYRDLVRTVGSELPEFESLKRRLLPSLRGTDIQVVNSLTGATPQIDWKSSYSFILVGGQAMDRGFTVEGLTVTYMPRGIGEGNADTVQQRARFFGYKQPYRGYCRVYLDPATRAAFEEYVTHEEDLRAQLSVFAQAGKSLKAWRREFLLTDMLHPTRKNILDIPYVRETVTGSNWIWIRRPHHESVGMNENSRIIDGFFSVHDTRFSEVPGSPKRTPAQRPLWIEDLDLRSVYESLLAPLQFSFFEDSQRWTAMLLVLKWYMRQHQKRSPGAPLPVAVVRMGTDRLRGLTVRSRELSDTGAIKNLFQGEAPVDPRELRGTVYPGDQRICAPDRVTIQIHRLQLTVEGTGAVVIPLVYSLAVLVPQSITEGVLLQEQGGADAD